MTRSRRLAALLFFPALLPFAFAGGTPRPEVKLTVLKHKQFLDEIKKQQGKVVVVDFWGEFCLPCKKEFPHLVELHKKHAADGVACVSVSVDQLEDKKAALKFLKAKGATFANYLLDENPPVWQEHWDLNGPPAVFVFDPAGKMVGRFVHGPKERYTYDDVEKLVRKLLAAKAKDTR